MISIRASELPLLTTCPAAVIVEPVRVESRSAEATIGTAVHWLLATSISVTRPNDELIDEAAHRFQIVDRDDLARTFWWAWRAWRELAQHFRSPETEVDMRWVDDARNQLTGHADVLSVVGDEVRVADFKTGRLDSDHEAQIRAYCWLALQRHPDAKTAYGAVLRTRDHVVDGWQWSRNELAAWWDRLVSRLTAERLPYNPGPHCAYCPRGLSCSAKTQLVSQAARALADTDVLGALPADPAERGRLFGTVLDQVKVITAICDQARDLIKADVIQSGGRLPTGDGRELVIVEIERTEIAGTAEAIAHVATRIGANHLGEVTRVSKTDYEKAVKATAGRGQKTAVWAEALEELRACGAVTKTPIQRLEIKKSAVQQLEHSEV